MALKCNRERLALRKIQREINVWRAGGGMSNPADNTLLNSLDKIIRTYDLGKD